MAEFITSSDGTKAVRTKEINAVFIQTERVSEEVTNYNVHIRASWLVCIVFESFTDRESAVQALASIVKKMEKDES